LNLGQITNLINLSDYRPELHSFIKKNFHFSHLYSLCDHTKNDFAKESKILRDTD